MKILIGIPCFDMVHTGFMQSMLDLKKTPDTSYTVVKNSVVYEARNIIALNAIKAGFDAVAWFDSDMRIPKDALLRMEAIMEESGVDFVSGLYFTRADPIRPVAFKHISWAFENNEVDAVADWFYGYPDNEIVPVEAVGFGCCMTSTKLLKRVRDEVGLPFAPMPGFGEDLSFCWRVKQLNQPILLDTGIKCGHLGQKEFNESDFKGGVVG